MQYSEHSASEIVRNLLGLEKGCQYYNLSKSDYGSLVSQVSTALNVGASTASELLDPFIDAGDISVNDQWSSSISYTSAQYGVDAATAAQLLSKGLPYLPVDGTLSLEQWNNAISEVSANYNVDAAEAARLLSVNMNETVKQSQSNMSLEQWRSAISSVSSQYNVDAASAAQMLSQNLTLSMGRYPIKCLRVGTY